MGWLSPSQRISLQHVVMFDSILPTKELLSKLESIIQNSDAVLSTKILNPLLSFQPSSQHLHQRIFHLKKPFSLLIPKKQVLLRSTFIMILWQFKHTSLHMFLFVCLFVFTSLQLLYYVVLVSGVQQSDSVINIHIFTLSQILFSYSLPPNTK